MRKRRLTPDTVSLELEAPLIARKSKAGQFVIIRNNEQGERVPLTIADTDPGNNTITLVFSEVGKTTMELGALFENEYVSNVVGPLGKPSEMGTYGNVVCIGAGVAIAAIYPIVKELRTFRYKNHITTIIGARTSERLLFEDELRKLSHELHISTDDGSKGHHGFVTDVLQKILKEERRIDYVIAIGPTIMMKVVSDITRPFKIKTVVSLNSLMVDGTGMCGACRVEIDEKTMFTCVDGPEFDAHKVNFDLLMKRLNMYKEEENLSIEIYEKKKKSL